MQSATLQMVGQQYYPCVLLSLTMVLIVWASYLYYSSPRYLAAFLVNLAASVLAILLATITRFYLQRQNRNLERGFDAERDRSPETKINVVPEHGRIPARIG